MIRLRISKRILRTVAWIAGIIVLIVGLYGLGATVTLRGADGRPLILSPSLRAGERYRGRANRWVERMATVDEGLTTLLAASGPPGTAELYERGQAMQRIGERAARLVNEVKTTEVPIALVGLREQLLETAQAYFSAAEAAARWMNAPSEAGRRQAVAALREARALRLELEESQWLSAREN